ncbi:autophagy protein 16 [Wallemia mellicola]|uniref:Autophagy protein 16 n=1 Tax=Wallemia mellicola TaxID=1708541 RepID=A0AB74KCX4_9BASI|nr:autophagy protein 16 [Wallemia mellicola]TIC61166.1 autophagy protein 16 [Wallemia mellicola]
MIESWTEELRRNLLERDSKQRINESYADNYKRLLQQYHIIKEQNDTLIKASEEPSTDSNLSSTNGNKLQAALVHSLQQQLHSTRDELTNLYKGQNQSSQRLLEMNETLRERDDNLRAIEAENLSLKASVSRLSKAREDDVEGKRERERGMEALQDEITTLRLELEQIEIRNQNLKNDNAALIQRWLDRMNQEADKMNDANETIPISNNAGATTDLDTDNTDDDFTDLDK